MVYTFSKISCYLNCPRKFKFKYIDKIKVPQKECFKHGNEIHSILENYPGKTNQKIEKFFKSDLGSEIKNVLENKKTLREYKYALNKDFKQTNYFDKNALFRGIMDLVFYENDTLNLIDYKTGKYHDIKYQDFNQLLCSSLFFFNSQKINKIKLRYIYVEANLENALEVTRTSIDSSKMYIINNTKKIESDLEFKKITKFCNWCEYKNICEAKNEKI